MKTESHWPKNQNDPRVKEEITFKANYSRLSILALPAIFLSKQKKVSCSDRGSPKQHSYQV